MKLSVERDTDLCQYVQKILLNGIRQKTAVELDTEEGWVDVLIPKIENAIQAVSGRAIEVPDALPEFDWEKKRLFGKVEVIWDKDAPILQEQE